MPRASRIAPLLALLLVATSLAALPAQATADDCGLGTDASSDAFAPSAVTTPLGPCTGNLGSSDARDAYGFHLDAGQAVNVTVGAPAGTQLSACVLAPDGSSQACEHRGAGATTHLTEVTATVGGTYVLVVSLDSGGGDYTLEVDGPSGVPAQDDCDLGTDAPAGASAPYLHPGLSCDGAFPEGDEMDSYSLDLHRGDTVTATMTRDANYPTICLQSPTGGLTCDMPALNHTGLVGATVQVSGQWSLYLYVDPGIVSSYHLNVTLARPAADDCRTGGDAGDDAAHASRVFTPMNRCEAELASSETQDWYAFNATKGDPLSASVQDGPFVGATLCLFAPAASTPAACASAGTGAQASLALNATATGAWRARVQRDSGAGFYSLSLVDHRAGMFNDPPVLRLLTCDPGPHLVNQAFTCTLIGHDDGPQVFYTWTYGDGRSGLTAAKAPGDPALVTVRYSAAGSYVFRARISDNDLRGPPTSESGNELTITLVVGPGSSAATSWNATLATPSVAAHLQDQASRLAGYRGPTLSVYAGQASFPLDRPAAGGEAVSLSWTQPADLDVLFQDSQGRALPGGCATSGLGSAESCVAPAGARFLVVRLATGAVADFGLKLG